MKLRIIVSAVCVALCSAITVQAQAAAGCTLVKGYYHCDQAAFLSALKAARTAAVQSPYMDRAGANALGSLARALGKTETSEPADLVFVLSRPEPDAIFYGPRGRELAFLNIYGRGPLGERGSLIWNESFYGQEDMPWPIVVHQLVAQFKDSIK